MRPRSGELVLERTLGVGWCESAHPLRGGGESDPVAGLAGPDPDADPQMGLAGAGWTQEHHVFSCSDEIERA